MAASKDLFSFPPSNNKQQSKEIVTPHKIAIVLLIKEQCAILESDHGIADPNEANAIPFMKGFCMLSLKLIQSPDMPYTALLALLSGQNTEYKISLELLEKFKSEVDNLLEQGLGALLDIIGNVGKLIGTNVGHVTKSSVLGLFLRRVLLHFDKLPFSQIVLLFKQFEVYVKNPSSREEDDPSLWSRKQAELFFAREATKLINDDPSTLQTQISQLLLANPDYAEAHFLGFLNCVRNMELCGARTSLHHCFDRASLPPDKPTATTNTNIVVLQGEEKSCRYATLILAAMHMRFGHKEEASMYLKETIKLAHAAGDSVCLQHCLSWLYNLAAENKESLMERSMARCTELGLSYLMSLGVQSYTKYCGLTGGRPSVVFDVLIRSDILNCQHILSNLAVNAYSLKAALWSLYGQGNMASLCCQQLLRLNSQQPHVCHAMCTVAKTLADKGEFEHSMVVLSEVLNKFPSKGVASWKSSVQEVFFSYAANQNDLGEAANALTLLAPVRPWESVLRRSWLLRWQGDMVGSMDLAQAALAHCKDGWFTDPELPTLKVKALVAASETLSQGEAIGCLLHALALAQTYYLHHLAALITLHIANIQLDLCLPVQALRLIEASLPAVLSGCSVQAKGRAMLLLARCRLAISTQPSMQQSLPVVSYALQLLTKAQDNVRIKHCYYLKAMIYNGLGLNEERNKWAHQFRQLDATCPTPQAFISTF